MGSRKAKMARTRPWDSPRGLICSTPLAQSADMMQDLRKVGLIRDQNLVFILWLDGIPDEILVWLLDVFGMVIWQTQNICWTSLIYIGIINDGGQHEVVIFYGHPSQNGNPNIMTIELQELKKISQLTWPWQVFVCLKVMAFCTRRDRCF